MPNVATTFIRLDHADVVPDNAQRSLGAISASLSSWLQDTGRMQSEAVRFFNARIERDATYLTRLARCRSPWEFVTLQVELFGALAADYMGEGQAQLSLLRDAAQHGLDQSAKAAAAATAH